MKLYQINLDNLSIEIHNSWYGVESILINGSLVSKKFFNMLGSVHEFQFNNDQFRLTSGYNVYGHTFTLRKNDEMIIDSPINKYLTAVLIIIFVILIADKVYS